MEGVSLAQTCVDETTTELTYSPWKKYGGDISYEVDDEKVIVTFIPRDGWGITEIHLLVTRHESELSTVPGQFPIGEEFDSAKTEPFEYEISFDDLGLGSNEDLEDLYIYAHAVTGEVSGSSGGGGGWWGSKWNKGRKWNKWGKKDRWSKKDRWDKKDRKDDDKKYCDKTESVWAKIHIESFEECDGGGIGGDGDSKR